MTTTTPRDGIRAPVHVFSLTCALWLLCFLPLAGRFRTPGGIDSSWLPLLLADGALLFFNVLILMKCRLRSGQRVVIFCSTGVTILIGCVLWHFYNEQRAYDYWAHHGISYFGDLN